MTIIYASATDHINKHTYPATIPPYTFNIHPSVIKKDLFAPPYEVFDQNLPQKAMITIADMVSFVISNTTFTIINDYDVLAILHQIDSYVEEVYPLRMTKTVSEYIERILKLRVRIYTLFRRVLNRHPQWKAAYNHGDGIFKILLDLYSPLGMTVDVPNAMLDELSVCPTIRAHPDQFKGILQSPVKTSSNPSPNMPNYNV